MGQFRLPFTLMLIITLLSLFANIISIYVGPLEYQGQLTYVYIEGDDPIVAISFNFDSEIAEKLIILGFPSGWGHTATGNLLYWSQGSLGPGGSFIVDVSFKNYVEPGEYPFTAVGVTSEGDTDIAEGILVVTEMILLKILWILNDYLVPLGVFTGLLGVLEVFSIIRGRTTKIPEEPSITIPTEDVTPPPIITETVDLNCLTGYNWIHQVMDLNVFPHGRIRILSDDPLPFKAYAYDRHALIHTCTCPKTGAVSRKSYIMFANVRYEWEIISGIDPKEGGGFIQQNDGTETQRETGQMIIFQPPDIEDLEDEKNIKIKVTAHHDDNTKPPDHEPVEVYLNMTIKREITETGSSSETENEFTDPGEIKDEYIYNIELQKELAIGNEVPPDAEMECIPSQNWADSEELKANIAATPKDVAYGDYIKLQATGSDTHLIYLNCTPSEGDCIEGSLEKLEVNDTLVYSWRAEKGRFPRGSHGREVIWQAPDDPGPVKIFLEVRDNGRQFTDKVKKDNVTINVHKLGIDLVKTPKTWVPIATAGILSVPAKTYLCINNKWTAPGRKKFIRLKLKKISREPGVCMNYPKTSNKNPDLFFYEDKMEATHLFKFDKTINADCPTEILKPGDNPVHENHYLYSILKKRNNETTPAIRVEDYGGTGVLQAIANHCIPIPPREELNTEHKDCVEGPNDIKIPRDENNNDIADIVSQDANGAAGNTDVDRKPIAAVNGDGITNYEEYRGFIVGGQNNIQIPTAFGSNFNITLGTAKKHIRTNVDKKDVFVYDEDYLGTGMLNETNLDIHILYHADLFNGTDKREINFNHGRHHGGLQHGLWLRTFNNPGLYGRSCYVSAAEVNGPPRVKTHVCINRSVCTSAGEPANRLSNTIAHELCHGLNIWHHGEGGNHACGDADWNFTSNSQGKLTSGAINCFMRYDMYATAWCHGAHHTHRYKNLTLNPDGTITRTWLDSPGTTLCNSPNGTGLNNAGAGHINNAERGNCRNQLRVKDW